MRSLLSRWKAAVVQLYRHPMGVARRPGAPISPEARPADLDRFEGMWVAVRDGAVIAAAPTSRELVYAVRKLADRGNGAVAQYVPPPESFHMVGVG